MIYKFSEYLVEGRYDKTINSIVREFIANFKERFGVRYKYTTAYEHDDDNTVAIEIIAKPSGKVKSGKSKYKIKEDYDLIAHSSIEKIDISLVYNMDFFPFTYNKLIADLKNTLRHEFTHIKQEILDQDDFIDKSEEDYLTKPSNRDSDSYTEEGDEYFFQEDEIEAFVNGFYKEAKTKRQSFTKTIDNWLEDNYKYFQDKANVLRLRKIWLTDFKNRYGKKYL